MSAEDENSMFSWLSRGLLDGWLTLVLFSLFVVGSAAWFAVGWLACAVGSRLDMHLFLAFFFKGVQTGVLCFSVA